MLKRDSTLDPKRPNQWGKWWEKTMRAKAYLEVRIEHATLVRSNSGRNGLPNDALALGASGSYGGSRSRTHHMHDVQRRSHKLGQLDCAVRRLVLQAGLVNEYTFSYVD
jgi:hypothetical protein